MVESPVQILRYEIKYAVEMLDAASITASLLMHPASFRKAFF